LTVGVEAVECQFRISTTSLSVFTPVDDTVVVDGTVGSVSRFGPDAAVRLRATRPAATMRMERVRKIDLLMVLCVEKRLNIL
jgi:hypothetical protein